MSYQTYEVRLNWMTAREKPYFFRANLAEASASIYRIDEDCNEHITVYQTADAKHRVDEAAKLLFGSEGEVVSVEIIEV